MRWGYFQFQLRTLLIDKKNQLLLALALVAMVAYVGYFAAATQPPEAVQPKVMAIEVKAITDYLPKHGGQAKNAGIAARAASERAFLAALARHDRAGILSGMQAYLRRLDNQWTMADDYSYPITYYQDRGPQALPRQDGHYQNLRLATRVRDYQRHRQVPVTTARLNERTTLQTLMRASLRVVPIAVMLLAITMSNRLVTADWRHATLQFGLPLPYRTRLWLKTLAVWVVLMALGVVFVALVAVTTLNAGWGSGAGVAVHVGAHFDFVMVSLAQALGQTAVLTASLAFVWIRLTLLLQLLLRNEYVALLVGLALLGSPLLYWQRGIGRYQGWTLNWLASYTEVGQVVTGQQNYLYDAPSMTGIRAGWVVLGWWLVIELALAGLVWRERRKGWAA